MTRDKKNKPPKRDQIKGITESGIEVIGSDNPVDLVMIEAFFKNPGTKYVALYADPDWQEGTLEVLGEKNRVKLFPQEETSKPATASDTITQDDSIKK